MEIKNRVTALEHVKGSDLRPHPKNPRMHPDGQIKALGGILEQVGISGALIAYRAGDGVLTLIDGHCRGEHWQDVEWPVLVLDVTDEEANLILATHDPITGMAHVDEAKMQRLLDSVEIECADLLDALRGGGEMEETPAEEVPDAQVDHLERLDEKWMVQDGSVWEIESTKCPGNVHRIVCGDSTDPANVKLAQGELSPILMVTDPPYGVNYDPKWRVGVSGGARLTGEVRNDDVVDWAAVYKLSECDVAYVWHASWFIDQVKTGLESAGFDMVSLLIWVKQHFALSRGDYHWQHEPCWYAVKKGRPHNWQGARDQATTWSIQNNNCMGNSEREVCYGHSTQKPLECMARPIRNNTAPGQGVFDPFLGSGTTIVACEALGRVGCGIELDPKYVAVCLQRLEDMGLEPRQVA